MPWRFVYIMKRYDIKEYPYVPQHGGDDVPIYATGPMAHLFSRTHDQTHIAYVMAYSACIGPFKNDIERCNKGAGT